MKNIYVVMGSCGEYDDYREWIVATYPNRIDAEKHKYAALKEATICREQYKRHKYEYDRYDLLEKVLAPFAVYDKNIPGNTRYYSDYDKIDYDVLEAPWFESFDEAGSKDENKEIRNTKD